MLPGAADDRNGSHSQHLPFRNVNAEIADEAQQGQTTPLSFFNKLCKALVGYDFREIYRPWAYTFLVLNTTKVIH